MKFWEIGTQIIWKQMQSDAMKDKIVLLIIWNPCGENLK